MPVSAARSAPPPPSLSPVSLSANGSTELFESRTLFERDIWQHRHELLTGIEDNILFLDSEKGGDAYQQAHRVRIDREHVRASLNRFRTLLLTSESSEDLRHSLRQEFKLYRSVGMDGAGTVRFTGYFQPSYRASRFQSDEYPYPIYRMPEDFTEWTTPHPTRVELEGYLGKGSAGNRLRGYELAWFRNRFEAFMVHVQGSAILEFSDGSKSAVGFAAGTSYPFRGIPQTFLDQHGVAWNRLNSFFEQKPHLLDQLLARNNRFIFFQEQPHALPMGSIGVPVMAERSIATDKLRLPPGAIGIIRANLPQRDDSGAIRLKYTSRLVLDQDTGSAIRGPGRVDVFMGTGEEGRQLANMTYSSGELYYFLLNSTSDQHI